MIDWGLLEVMYRRNFGVGSNTYYFTGLYCD